MNKTVKKTITYLLTIGGSLILLYFAFRGIDWREFFSELGQCNWWWAVLSMFLGFTSTLSRGLRWRLMMLPIGPKLGRRECYDTYSICYLANLAVPRSGELIRCGILAKRGKVSLDGAIGSMILERTWDLIVCGAVLVAVIFLTPFRKFMVNDILAPWISSLNLVSILLMAAGCVMLVFLAWIFLSPKSRLGNNAVAVKLRGFLLGMKDGIKAGFKMEHKGLFHFHTILIQVIYWAQSYCIIKAFGPMSHMNAMDALFVHAVGSIGFAVPVQGGFGAYHLIVSMVLVPVYGIPQQTGLIFATLSHESQVVQMIICGCLSLLSIALMNRSYRRKVNIAQ